MKQSPITFLDTSVIIAAVFSPDGGSAGILDLAKQKILRIVMSETVVIEAYRTVKKKYDGRHLASLEKLLIDLQSGIMPSPTLGEIKIFDDLITDQNDRHILAGAQKYLVDYLVTLDRKHFMTQKIADTHFPFKIVTPKDLFADIRKQFED